MQKHDKRLLLVANACHPMLDDVARRKILYTAIGDDSRWAMIFEAEAISPDVAMEILVQNVTKILSCVDFDELEGRSYPPIAIERLPPSPLGLKHRGPLLAIVGIVVVLLCLILLSLFFRKRFSI